MQRLNNTINTAIYEVTEFVEKGECAARYIQDRHRNTLIIAANFQNLTTQYRRFINDINQRRISLANMAAMMQDANIVACTRLFTNFADTTGYAEGDIKQF